MCDFDGVLLFLLAQAAVAIYFAIYLFCFCLFLCLFVCLSVCLFVCLFVCLSVQNFEPGSDFSSPWMSVMSGFTMMLGTFDPRVICALETPFAPNNLFFSFLFVCLFVCLSVCVFVCLSVLR